MSDLLRRRAMMAQSRGKTMQLLAEYTVTEPVNRFAIPLTKAMLSCSTLYCVLNITDMDEDWPYFMLATTSTARTGGGYWPKAKSVSENFRIFLDGAKTVDGVTFPTQAVSTPYVTGNMKVGSYTYLYAIVYLYQETTYIKAGSLKIYGEV